MTGRADPRKIQRASSRQEPRDVAEDEVSAHVMTGQVTSQATPRISLDKKTAKYKVD
jgi:hypothetical protein